MSRLPKVTSPCPLPRTGLRGHNNFSFLGTPSDSPHKFEVVIRVTASLS